MSSSAGRRDKHYLAAKARFQQGDLPCHICGVNPGTTPDHVPPLHTAPHWRLWQGHYLPACRPCQNREGGTIIANRTRQPAPSRQW